MISKLQEGKERASNLHISLLMSAITCIISSILMTLLLMDPGPSDPDDSALGAGIAFLALAPWLAISWCATPIIFLMWLYQAYENLKQVGDKKTDMAADQAVFRMVSPGVNLWHGPRILREVYNRSQVSNIEPVPRKRPLLILMWQAINMLFFLIALYLVFLNFYRGSQYMDFFFSSRFARFLLIGAAQVLLTIAITGKIQRLQSRLTEQNATTQLQKESQ